MIVTGLPLWQPTREFLPWVRSTPALAFTFERSAARRRCCRPRCSGARASRSRCRGRRCAAGRLRPRVARVNAINTVGALARRAGLHAGRHSVPRQPARAAGPRPARGRRRGRACSGAPRLARVLTHGRWPRSRRWPRSAIVPPVPGRLIAYGRSVDSWTSIKRFLYLAEGATASVAVTEGIGGARQFHIAGKVEASDMDVDMRLERMLGHVPALVHPAPALDPDRRRRGRRHSRRARHSSRGRADRDLRDRAGGAGQRARSSSPRRTTTSSTIRARSWSSTMRGTSCRRPRRSSTSSRRIRFIHGCAARRRSIRSSTCSWCAITSNPGGVVTQWMPLYETDVRSVKSEIATFAQVFPDTTLWNPDLLEEGYDLVALGRVEPAPISEAAIDAAARRERRRAPIARGGDAEIGGRAARTYAGRGQDLAPWLADARNQPRAAFAAAVSGRPGGQHRRALPDLPGDPAVPPLSGGSVRRVRRTRSATAALVYGAGEAPRRAASRSSPSSCQCRSG